MSEATSQPFTIEQFYKLIGQGRLMASKCRKCGNTMLPPRTVCSKCYSKDMEWIELKPEGRLLTYTIIHVAPPQFQHMTPYAVGVMELESGLKIPGIIKNVEHEKIKVGMKLKIEFETSPATTTQTQWPSWPRYHFKPS